MKRKAQCAILIAATAALAFAIGRSSDADEPTVTPPRYTFLPSQLTLRVCAKEMLARAVVDEELSLPEAAALCGEVYRRLPDKMGPGAAADDGPFGPPPAKSDEEWLCRHVIRWVRTLEDTADVVARLEAEFREWRRQGHGRLPDPELLKLSADELLHQAWYEWLAETRGREKS